MNTGKSHKRKVGLAACLIIIAVGLLALAGYEYYSSERASEQQRAFSILRNDIRYILHSADSRVGSSITIEERQDENGRTYLIGVLSDSLESEIEVLVDAFNSDPSTAEMLTAEEVRYNLTEGIAEAFAKENLDSPFIRFLEWTGKQAQLVYAMTITDPSGTVHVEGDPAEVKSLTNYGFSTHREGNFFYRYAWE